VCATAVRRHRRRKPDPRTGRAFHTGRTAAGSLSDHERRHVRLHGRPELSPRPRQARESRRRPPPAQRRDHEQSTLRSHAPRLEPGSERPARFASAMSPAPALMIGPGSRSSSRAKRARWADIRLSEKQAGAVVIGHTNTAAFTFRAEIDNHRDESSRRDRADHRPYQS